MTRHVPEELRNDDWNTMVLHYLGMDHIGHKAGPRRLTPYPIHVGSSLTNLAQICCQNRRKWTELLNRCILQ